MFSDWHNNRKLPKQFNSNQMKGCYSLVSIRRFTAHPQAFNRGYEVLSKDCLNLKLAASTEYFVSPVNADVWKVMNAGNVSQLFLQRRPKGTRAQIAWHWTQLTWLQHSIGLHSYKNLFKTVFLHALTYYPCKRRFFRVSIFVISLKMAAKRPTGLQWSR